MQQSGFFWHAHHDVLFEWCFNYNERAEYIKTDKPRGEQEIRLKLFQPVREILPAEVVKVRRVYNEALRKHMPEIEKLHAKECPNCPWDGKTIFPVA